jgi:hypothetical protein
MNATFHTFTTVLFPKVGMNLDRLSDDLLRLDAVIRRIRTDGPLTDRLLAKRDEAEARYAEANSAARTDYFNFRDAVAAVA